MRVAVIGTGTMGAGIARSLLRAGIDVTVWNRHPDKAASLMDAGATMAESPRNAVRQAEVVLTVLFDEAAVTEVANEFLDSMPDQAVWMQSATVGPTATRRLAHIAAEHHVAFVDAPVVGTKKPAEDGTLVVLVSGGSGVIEQLTPVLAAIGTKSVTVGDEPGGASALKLACNAWIASVTAAVGQSLTMSSALGVDPRLFLSAIDGGPSNAPYAQLKGDMMIEQDFSPAFAVDGMLKDLELMESELDVAPASTALVGTLRDLFARASSSGHGSEDVAAVITALNSR